MTLKNILPLGKPSQLLVCETDGFSLHGAVLERSGSRIVLLHQAKTGQVDMAEAVADVVAMLKADGWKGGGSAVLLTPAVLSALAELPVNPKKPRPVAQMMELVRWEAEPLLMQHMTRWTVGQLLAGQGYMTEEQVQAVMDLQQGKPNPAGGLALSDKFSSRRFGDLAEELGYIKRSQLNACLAAQAWLKADDELIECNWTPQGAVEDIPGTFHWLVSCVGQSLLRRWTEVFDRQGVRLKSMYPSVGCGVNLLPKSQTAGLILEPHRRQALATRLNAGKITAQHQHLSLTQSPLEICLESYHAMQAAPNEPLWLAGGHNAQLLAADMRQMLAVEVNEPDDPAIGETVTPGMAGAARHALGISGEGRCVGVREGGPLPPLPQRLEVRAAALAALLLASVAAAEVSLMIRKDAVEAHKQEVDARWKSIDEAARRIKSQTEQIEQRKKALAQQKADQTRLEAMLNFYSHAIPERGELVRSVLGVLQEAVTDEVIIVSINETAKSANAKMMPPPPALPDAMKDKRIEVENFNIEAWAISEAAAQSFIQKMKEKVAPWHLEVRDAQVSSHTGPLNLDGFAVLMRLVRLIEADAAAPVQQKAGAK